jgi:hypothetical protein
MNYRPVLALNPIWQDTLVRWKSVHEKETSKDVQVTVWEVGTPPKDY